jgi:hypothetical protein
MQERWMQMSLSPPAPRARVSKRAQDVTVSLFVVFVPSAADGIKVYWRYHITFGASKQLLTLVSKNTHQTPLHIPTHRSFFYWHISSTQPHNFRSVNTGDFVLSVTESHLNWKRFYLDEFLVSCKSGCWFHLISDSWFGTPKRNKKKTVVTCRFHVTR